MPRACRRLPALALLGGLCLQVALAGPGLHDSTCAHHHRAADAEHRHGWTDAGPHSDPDGRDCGCSCACVPGHTGSPLAVPPAPVDELPALVHRAVLEAPEHRSGVSAPLRLPPSTGPPVRS